MNNPLKFVDPDGKDPITLTAAGVNSVGVITIAIVGHTYNYITNSAYRNNYDSFVSSTANVTVKAVEDTWNALSSLFSSSEPEIDSKSNTKIGPNDEDINVVDKDGNVIPLKKGQTIEDSPDGSVGKG